MQVRPDMTNGHHICHGGFVFALADSAFAFACNSYGDSTVAAAASIDFLAPVREGDALTATARELWRGGRSGLYEIVVTQPARRASRRCFAAAASAWPAGLCPKMRQEIPYERGLHL